MATKLSQQRGLRSPGKALFYGKQKPGSGTLQGAMGKAVQDPINASFAKPSVELIKRVFDIDLVPLLTTGKITDGMIQKEMDKADKFEQHAEQVKILAPVLVRNATAQTEAAAEIGAAIQEISKLAVDQQKVVFATDKATAKSLGDLANSRQSYEQDMYKIGDNARFQFGQTNASFEDSLRNTIASRRRSLTTKDASEAMRAVVEHRRAIAQAAQGGDLKAASRAFNELPSATRELDRARAGNGPRASKIGSSPGGGLMGRFMSAFK